MSTLRLIFFTFFVHFSVDAIKKDIFKAVIHFLFRTAAKISTSNMNIEHPFHIITESLTRTLTTNTTRQTAYLHQN